MVYILRPLIRRRKGKYEMKLIFIHTLSIIALYNNDKETNGDNFLDIFSTMKWRFE